MLVLLPLIIAPSLAGESATVTVDAETIQSLSEDKAGATFARTTYATVVEGKIEYSVVTEQTCDVTDSLLSCEGTATTGEWTTGFAWSADAKGITTEVHDAFLDEDEALTRALLFPDLPDVGTEYSTYCGRLAAELGDIVANIGFATSEYSRCMAGGVLDLSGSWLDVDSFSDTGQTPDMSGDSAFCQSELDDLKVWLDLLGETSAAWDRADCDNPNSPGWSQW